MSTKSYRKKEQNNSDEINFDEYLFQLKKIVFKLFAFYNKRIFSLPRFLIYALSFVQFLQTLFFIVNPDLGMYLREGAIVERCLNILSYISGYALVKSGSGVTNFFTLLCIFLWLVFSMFLLYYSYTKIARTHSLQINVNTRGYMDSEKSIASSKLQTLLINLCVGHLLLVNTILAIPYFCIIYPVFYCTEKTMFSYSLLGDKQCYDITHITGMVLGLVSILIVIALKGACIVLMYQHNPLKLSIYACSSNISLLFKTGANILCVWYLIIDPQFSFKPLYIGGLVLVYGWYLFMFRWQQVGFYDRYYMNFMLCLEIMLLCFAANNLVQYFFQGGTKRGISFVEFVLASCMLAFSAMSVLDVNKKKMVRGFYCGPQAMKKSQQAQNFIIQLIYHLLSQPNPKKRQTNARIFMKQLDLTQGSKLSLTEPKFVQQVKTFLQTNQQSVPAQQQRFLIYQYFRILIEQLIAIKSCFLFEGLWCALLFQYGLKTKALCQIYKLEAGKLDWMEEFFLFEITQRNCVAQGDVDDPGNQLDQVDQQKIVVYDQYVSLMSNMQQAIVESIMVNKEFWSQILQQHPDFEYAKKLSSRLNQNHKQILKIHLKIGSIFQNSLKQKFLYYSYLQLLQWSKQHNQEMLQFLQINKEMSFEKNSAKLFLDEIKDSNFAVMFQENEKIIMIELDFSSTEGVIKNCSSQVFEYTGYTKNELIGRKIDKILPGPVAAKHPKFLQNFINKKDSISKSLQRVVYAVHKSRFIMPGYATIKVISNEQKGLKLAGFIRPLSHQQRQFGLVTAENDTIILGVTKQIMLKIRDEQFLEDIKNQSVYLELLFPKLKVQEMKQDVFYQVDMVTMNSVQRQYQGETNARVSIKYQVKRFQENLTLKYYYVRLHNKFGTYPVGTMAAIQTSCHQLPSQVFTTSHLIQNFTQKRQQQKRAKMQQLCRYKQNYLNKHNQTKYFMCFLVFLVVVAVVICLSVFVFRTGNQFEEGVDWKRVKMQKINSLARDLSELEEGWLASIEKEDGLDAKQLEQNFQAIKQKYAQLVLQFNNNFQRFRQNTQVNELDSVFNLKILPNKTQKFKSLLTVQTQAHQFADVQPIDQSTPENLAMYEIQRTSIMINTRQLLQYYLDEELSLNFETSAELDSISQMKFILGTTIVVILLMFSAGVWFGMPKMMVHLDRNLQLINFLSYTEIFTLVTGLNEYLKLFLSSQLQSIEQLETVHRIVSDPQVSRASINVDERQNNREKIMRMYQTRNMDSVEDRHIHFQDDQSSLNLQIHHNQMGNSNQTSEQRLSSNVIQVGQRRSSNFLDQKEHNQRSSSKRSIKNIRESDHLDEKKNRISSHSSFGLSKVGPNAAFTKGSAMKGANARASIEKRKIGFANDSEITGLELSARALQYRDSYDYTNNDLTSKDNKRMMPNILHSILAPARKERKRAKTRSTAVIQLPYPAKYHRIIICLILITTFAVLSYTLFRLQQDQQSLLVVYENSINGLIKISTKLMYLRSYMGPYFGELKDENGMVIVRKEDLMREIRILQGYTTVSFGEMQNSELVLKNVYRDLTMYIYLMETYQPNQSYLSDLSSRPTQLHENMLRIQTNFLLRHQQITQLIQTIQNGSSYQQTQLRLKYIMQLISSVVMFGVILGIEYYIVVWRLKVDEKATFTMVRFFPLRMIAANRVVYRAIKKESSRMDG